MSLIGIWHKGHRPLAALKEEVIRGEHMHFYASS